MLRAINRVHTGWQQQSLMYINEHIYVQGGHIKSKPLTKWSKNRIKSY